MATGQNQRPAGQAGRVPREGANTSILPQITYQAQGCDIIHRYIESRGLMVFSAKRGPAWNPFDDARQPAALDVSNGFLYIQIGDLYPVSFSRPSAYTLSRQELLRAAGGIQVHLEYHYDGRKCHVHCWRFPVGVEKVAAV